MCTYSQTFPPGQRYPEDEHAAGPPPNLASQIFLGNSQWNPMESHLMKCISDGYSDTPRCMDVPFMCPWIQLTPFWCDDLFWSMAYTYDSYDIYLYILCYIYIVLHQYHTPYIPFGPLRVLIYNTHHLYSVCFCFPNI